MTSKEKAAELIVNYQLKCKSLNYDEAKLCALIAIDELIRETGSKYYYEVKIEIDKL